MLVKLSLGVNAMDSVTFLCVSVCFKCCEYIANFSTIVPLKLVEYKTQIRLEEKRKRVLDQHLNFIVNETEKYSSLLTEGLKPPKEVLHFFTLVLGFEGKQSVLMMILMTSQI